MSGEAEGGAIGDHGPRDDQTGGGARAAQHTRQPSPRAHHAHDSRARRYALRSVRPSPARAAAPEPEVWLPILELTGALSATRDLDAELELLALEEGGADLDHELAAIQPATAALAPEPAVTASPAAVAIPAPAPQAEPAVATRHDIALRRRHLRTRRRALRTLVVALVLAVLAAGVATVLGPAQPRRYVNLSVDGQQSTQLTRAGTVGDLLAAQGVALGAHDRVVPAASTPLRDGLGVRVLRAFPVTVVVDGTPTTVRTTRSRVGALARELTLPAGAVVVAAPARIRRGATVAVRTPRAVTLQVDGARRTLRTLQPTVGAMLAAEGIAVGPNDEVSPAVGTAVTPGIAVQVTRLAEGQRAETVSVPFGVEQRSDATLAKGSTKVLQTGVNGVARRVYQVTLRDGVEAGRTLLRVETVQAARPQIVAVGTKAPVRVAAAPVASTSGHSQTGQGTHYAFQSASCAHKTLPFGTVVRITNLGTGASTTCTIRDRGPYAAGRIIDMSLDTFARLAPLSQGVINVRIDW